MAHCLKLSNNICFTDTVTVKLNSKTCSSSHFFSQIFFLKPNAFFTTKYDYSCWLVLYTVAIQLNCTMKCPVPHILIVD